MSRTAPGESDVSRHSSQPLSFEGYAPVSSTESNEKDLSANSTEDVRPEQAEMSPQKLRCRERQIAGVFVDALCLVLCISIIIFAGLVRKNNGVEMGTYQRQLLNTSRIATTFFPYLFALIVGRGIKNILNWRLTIGIKIISFTYLSKCSTLASTLITPLNLRTLHWAPLVLITIWGFSPLGSQGILRSVSEFQKNHTTKSTVLYYYPATSGLTSSPNYLAEYNSANALLFASFLSVGTSLHRSEDMFGNIKIPTLSVSNGYSGSSDWMNMTASRSATYSSLIGIPFVKPTNQGNSTFMIRSWYWHLSDPIVSLNIGGTGSLSNVRSYPGLPFAEQGWNNFTGQSGFWQFLLPNSTSLPNSPASLAVPIMFESANPDNPDAISISANSTRANAGITRLSANLTYRPVEIQIFCNKDSCNTTAVRPSEIVTPYPFEADFDFLTHHFLWWFALAIPITHHGTPYYDAFTFFLNDSSVNPFSKSYEKLPDLASLGATELASRLEQVINAYWIAHSALNGVIDLKNLNLTQLSGRTDDATALLANASATLLDSKTILKCDYRWLSVLYLATVVMMAAAAASLIFNLLYGGPEFCDFTSALMRSYRMPEIKRGTFSGDDLVRQLKDVSIKVGDISAEDDVGRIMIGPREVVGNLNGKRFYA